MEASKMLSLILNMSLVIIGTKVALPRSAHRIQLFCMVWQLHDTDTNSPMDVGTENLRKEKLTH